MSATPEGTPTSSEPEDPKEAIAELRQRLEKFERAEAQWKVREKEYETLLEQKSEVIRQQHIQLQGVREDSQRQAVPAGGSSAAPNEEELIALHRELEQDREQIKRDEAELHDQMREMEVQMSKERAELARQKIDLQKMHDAIRRELDIASRDAALREKLAPLYRLQEEMGSRRAGDGGPRPATPKPAIPLPAREAAPPPVQKAPPARETRRSGIFRRLFGGDNS